jgi:hypothetical protein
MFKKRYLLVLVLVILLFTLGAMTVISGDRYQVVRVCRNALSSVQGYGTWKYQRTSFHSPIRVYFSNGVNTAWCEMQQNGSEWEVTALAPSMVSPYP